MLPLLGDWLHEKKFKISLDSFQRYLISKNIAIWLAESILEQDFSQTCAFQRSTNMSHFWVEKKHEGIETLCWRKFWAFSPKLGFFWKFYSLRFCPLGLSNFRQKFRQSLRVVFKKTDNWPTDILTYWSTGRDSFVFIKRWGVKKLGRSPLRNRDKFLFLWLHYIHNYFISLPSKPLCWVKK